MIDMYKKVLVNQIDDDGKDIVQQDDKKIMQCNKKRVVGKVILH